MPFPPLSPPEARVLGCLVEKEMTTPEYYPMTLNGLTNACNQKTNREPVVSYGEDEVSDALDRLREKGLAVKVSGGGGRVPKTRHTLADALRLGQAEAAVLAVLMLRGPQTVGEIRSRTGRMFPFDSLEQVETTLEALSGPRSADGEALVTRLERQAGRKEYRYMHLLGGVPIETSPAAPDQLTAHSAGSIPAPSSPPDPVWDERLEALSQQVEALETELAALRRQFAEFKAQFE